jgi:glycosyltransferase involved in cell wall biosynthesis
VLFTIKENENKYTLQLAEYAKKNNLNITFNGPIKREKVFEMYTESVLLFPSFVESFGLPLLEARLSGAFIIANKTSFTEEILKDYENSLFFNGDKAIELASCIEKLSKKIYMQPKAVEFQKEEGSLIDLCISL